MMIVWKHCHSLLVVVFVTVGIGIANGSIVADRINSYPFF